MAGAMLVSHPIILAAAGGAAVIGLLWLLRPPRLRVVVTHRTLWQQAIAQAGGTRAWRKPRLATVLVGLGGIVLAAAAGGLLLPASSGSPEPVLIVLASTPHLAASPEGKLQRAELLSRLNELIARLGSDTPARVVAIGERSLQYSLLARQWDGDAAERVAAMLSSSVAAPDADQAIRLFRGSQRGQVYLLGEFTNVPINQPDVQWIFRPAPLVHDVAITAGGASQVGDAVHVFIRVERLAGSAANARLSIAGQQVEVDLSGDGVAGAAVVLPAADADHALTARLIGADDQPLNDVFHLARPKAVQRVVTFDIVGRPNEWIERAVRHGELLRRQAGQGPADWLIVNEPADPVVPVAGQAMVLIDPLVMPAGVRVIGELTNARVVSQSAEHPWAGLPLAGIAVRRASRVQLDSRWNTIAADEHGNPLIAYDSGARRFAILFSVAPSNSDWSSRVSWPLFWAALGGMESLDGAGPVEWTWRPGPWPGLFESDGEQVAVNVDPHAFALGESADRLAHEPELSQERPGASMWEVWPLLVGLALTLLLVGWFLDRRR